jgi:hypothetical protein
MASEYELGKSNLETLKTLIQRVVYDAAEAGQEASQTPALDIEKVVEEMEQFLGKLPLLQRMGLLTFLRLFEMAPLTLGYRHTFTHLERQDQVEYLNTLEKSRNYALRGLIGALKAVVVLVFFSQPESEKAIGYDKKCLNVRETLVSIHK